MGQEKPETTSSPSVPDRLEGYSVNAEVTGRIRPRR
jgi:hypothetical protein